MKMSIFFGLFLACLSQSAVARGGGGAGDGGGGSNDRPSFEEIKQSVRNLTSGNYAWALMPLAEYSYKDEKGAIQSDLWVSPRSSPELKPLLKRIGAKLGKRPLNFHFKTEGACHAEDGDQEASTQICEENAPICMSLPLIQKETPRDTLESALKALIMHEVAHQNCANEAMAKQVEKFFGSESVQKISIMRAISENFSGMDYAFQNLFTSLKGDDPSQDTGLCSQIGHAQGTAVALSVEIQATNFTNREGRRSTDQSMEELQSILRGMNGFCDGEDHPSSHGAFIFVEKGDRPALRSALEHATKAYNQLAREFSQSAGIKIWEWSSPSP